MQCQSQSINLTFETTYDATSAHALQRILLKWIKLLKCQLINMYVLLELNEIGL